MAAACRPPLRAAARARPARPGAVALAAARRPENHRRARADAASEMRVPRGHADARAARTKPLHADRCRDACLRRTDAPGWRGLTRLTKRPRGRLRRDAPRRRLRHPHAPARRAWQHVPKRIRPHSSLQHQRAPRVQHRRALAARGRSVLHDHARAAARLRQAGVALGRRQSPSARLRTRLAAAPRHTRLPPRNACTVRQRRHVPRNAGRRRRHAAVDHRRHAFHAAGRAGCTPIRLPGAAVAHSTISRRTPRDERALVRHVPRERVLARAIPRRQVGVRGGHHDRRTWELDGARQRRRPPAASRARRRQRRLKRLPRRRRLQAREQRRRQHRLRPARISHPSTWCPARRVRSATARRRARTRRRRLRTLGHAGLARRIRTLPARRRGLRPSRRTQPTRHASATHDSGRRRHVDTARGASHNTAGAHTSGLANAAAVPR